MTWQEMQKEEVNNCFLPGLLKLGATIGALYDQEGTPATLKRRAKRILSITLLVSTQILRSTIRKDTLECMKHKIKL